MTSEKYNSKNTLKYNDLNNYAFNKNGYRFITGTYDRTCIIWDTKKGNLLQKLIGHSNVVCVTILNSHNMEIVCLQFDKMSQLYWFIEQVNYGI